jgi:hypothetical protein
MNWKNFMNAKDEFRSLVSHTLLALKEQYSFDETFLSSPEVYHFFRKTKEKIQEQAPIVSAKAPPVPAFSQKTIPDLPKKERKVEEIKNTHHLEPISSSLIPHQEDWRSLCKKLMPKWKLTVEPLMDEQAKKIANMWKESFTSQDACLLFYFDETEKEVQFLKNVALAISQRFRSAKVVHAKRIEDEKKWDLLLKKDPLELILITPSCMQAKEMKKYYKEIPASSERFLGDFPLILLQPISSYLKTPSLKLALWKTLCQLLQK